MSKVSREPASSVWHIAPAFTAPVSRLTAQGDQIKTVGHDRFGFDSQVETDVLRSLYLVSGLKLRHTIRALC